MKKLLVSLFLCLNWSLSNPAFAKEVLVQMLNKAPDGEKMAFRPDVIKVSVGDTVKFVVSDKGHSVQSFKGAKSRPEGAKKFKSKLNKDFSYTVEHEGIHVIICKPHYAMGMIGLIVAGKPVNLETIKGIKVRGKKSKERFTRQLAQVGN